MPPVPIRSDRNESGAAPSSIIQLSLLVAVLALTATTRLIGLASNPPALIPDEASNAYDAYCLLETGRDRWGVAHPLHLEAFGKGDYRPALYAYVVAPFVALLGPERLDLAVRLPAALWGIGTVAGLYALVSRVGDRRTAFWAALFLALSPWHLRISRFGHESALTPGFVILALLLLARAGWPLRGSHRCGTSAGVRNRWMVVFGALVGLSFYTYASMWLFMPAMLLAGAFIYRHAVLGSPSAAASSGDVARSRPHRPLLAAVIAFLIVIAPLAWTTGAHWAQVSGRARHASLFQPGVSVGHSLARAAVQYATHYGPTWLFTRGDRSALSPLPGVGQINWYLLPLLPLGLITMWRQRRENRAYLVVLAWLLLYPLASALAQDAPHGNRAACGIGVFEWIAAVGFSTLTMRWANRPRTGCILGGVLAGAVLLNGAWVLHRYVTTVRSPFMAHLLQADLREAVVYLRGRWTDYDRIFISDHTSNRQEWANLHPYVYVLTYLPVTPVQFQSWNKAISYPPPDYGFHQVESMGPFTFSTRPEVLKEYFGNHPNDKVLIVGRPGDITTGGRLLHTIVDGRRAKRFELIEVVRP
jgi:hypothetical protein